MKTWKWLPLGLVFLSLAGCGNRNKVAEAYAQELSAVLKSYQEQVNKKLTAEKTLYRDQAALDARVRQLDAEQTLLLEREERSEKLADDLIKRGPQQPLAPSELKRQLLDYADLDFKKMRELYQGEMDREKTFTDALQDLQLESAKIEALQESLKRLATPRSKSAQLKELGQFLQDTNDRLDELECEDLKKDLAAQQTKLAAAKTDQEKKAINEKIATLQEQLKKCAKPTTNK